MRQASPQRTAQVNAVLGGRALVSHIGPSDKHDLEAVSRLSKLNPGELKQLIPELLEWMEDINWPVARPIAVLLAKCDTDLVPHIRAVFSSADAIWKYWILSELVPKLSPEAQFALTDDLTRLSTDPTDDERVEEVHLIAGELLQAKDVS